MGQFLAAVFGTVRRNLIAFLLIVLVLVAGKMIGSEWDHAQRVASELPELQIAAASVGAHQMALAEEMTGRVKRMSKAGVQQLDGEIRILEADIERLHRKQEGISVGTGIFKRPGGVVEELQRKAALGVEIEIRSQTRAYLVALRTHLVLLGDRQVELEKLERLRLEHVRIYTAIQSAEQQLSKIEVDAGVLGKIPFTRKHQQVGQLTAELKELKVANHRAHQDYRAQKQLLARLPLPAALNEFRINEQRLAQASAPLQKRLMEAEQWAEKNLLWHSYQTVRPVLPLALFVLVSWWLVPVAIRALFYYVLAPFAASRPAIVIRRSTSTGAAAYAKQRSGHDSSLISAVSRTISLAPECEMLIRPDYCQSQPVGVQASTILLFDWGRWLTSIAAHLWLLKRLRTAQSADIVVSSTSDALDEVALLEIGSGEAFVLQPRGLIGMMYPIGHRPKIRSHWRLGTLHAWLTLQLRYLAFEGPVTLVVKGCRGVRLEKAASDRTISQDATLGFSANAQYSTVRAEPFVPYLRGRQSLLQDKFGGQDAYYLYEEVPRNVRPDGQKHNPLEVLLDACLKAFGI